MATSREVKLCFLDPMLIIFHLPVDMRNDTGKVADFMAEYAENLTEFSVGELRDGWKVVKAQFKSFPKIAHCVEACRSVRKATPSEAKEHIIERLANIDRDARAIADNYLLSTEGRQATAEGWGRSYKEYQGQVVACFIRKGWLPRQIMIEEMDKAKVNYYRANGTN